MDRQNLERYIKNYISELNHEIAQPILERDTQQVKIDSAKVFFLLLPLLNGERWTAEMNTSAIAVGAVHVAFDAHDLIDRNDATSRQQQLTVLSGDYYSGIHYKLLASMSDFSFVKTLSTAIGRINEVKTEFYGRTPSTSKQLMDTVQIIESGCIVEFLRTFGFSRYAPLAELALPLLRIDKNRTSNKSLVTKQTIHSDYGWNENVDIVEQLTSELEVKLFEALNEANFIEPFLKEEIRGMMTPLLGKPI
ncbi:heptaprenyl diphosphate synthase component 1 [Sporosarcina sp. G11-34]|uniref:heptaprenyl diphosphate synthase component 1 n=1 Tax=Sporosarcina sp. G11-34 TaxID=2849605 RepID=UPI0022A8DB69|nr:heptaprenyl diphosphate synthase component 1 [Sporosarcina sp. G11-34]MCZ2259466.1 heptaprenyl diphosphate synthase component 1 [Sporosarcina sp. G11-34]